MRAIKNSAAKVARPRIQSLRANTTLTRSERKFTDTLGRPVRIYQESLHPRDRFGRWVEKYKPLLVKGPVTKKSKTEEIKALSIESKQGDLVRSIIGIKKFIRNSGVNSSNIAQFPELEKELTERTSSLIQSWDELKMLLAKRQFILEAGTTNDTKNKQALRSSLDLLNNLSDTLDIKFQDFLDAPLQSRAVNTILSDLSEISRIQISILEVSQNIAPSGQSPVLAPILIESYEKATTDQEKKESLEYIIDFYRATTLSSSKSLNAERGKILEYLISNVALKSTNRRLSSEAKNEILKGDRNRLIAGLGNLVGSSSSSGTATLEDILLQKLGDSDVTLGDLLTEDSKVSPRENFLLTPEIALFLSRAKTKDVAKPSSSAIRKRVFDNPNASSLIFNLFSVEPVQKLAPSVAVAYESNYQEFLNRLNTAILNSGSSAQPRQLLLDTLTDFTIDLDLSKKQFTYLSSRLVADFGINDPERMASLVPSIVAINKIDRENLVSSLSLENRVTLEKEIQKYLEGAPISATDRGLSNLINKVKSSPKTEGLVTFLEEAQSALSSELSDSESFIALISALRPRSSIARFFNDRLHFQVTRPQALANPTPPITPVSNFVVDTLNSDNYPVELRAREDNRENLRFTALGGVVRVRFNPSTMSLEDTESKYNDFIEYLRSTQSTNDPSKTLEQEIIDSTVQRVRSIYSQYSPYLQYALTAAVDSLSIELVPVLSNYIPDFLLTKVSQSIPEGFRQSPIFKDLLTAQNLGELIDILDKVDDGVFNIEKLNLTRVATEPSKAVSSIDTIRDMYGYTDERGNKRLIFKTNRKGASQFTDEEVYVEIEETINPGTPGEKINKGFRLATITEGNKLSIQKSGDLLSLKEVLQVTTNKQSGDFESTEPQLFVVAFDGQQGNLGFAKLGYALDPKTGDITLRKPQSLNQVDIINAALRRVSGGSKASRLLPKLNDKIDTSDQVAVDAAVNEFVDTVITANPNLNKPETIEVLKQVALDSLKDSQLLNSGVSINPQELTGLKNMSLIKLRALYLEAALKGSPVAESLGALLNTATSFSSDKEVQVLLKSLVNVSTYYNTFTKKIIPSNPNVSVVQTILSKINSRIASFKGSEMTAKFRNAAREYLKSVYGENYENTVVGNFLNRNTMFALNSDGSIVSISAGSGFSSDFRQPNRETAFATSVTLLSGDTFDFNDLVSVNMPLTPTADKSYEEALKISQQIGGSIYAIRNQSGTIARLSPNDPSSQVLYFVAPDLEKAKIQASFYFQETEVAVNLQINQARGSSMQNMDLVSAQVFQLAQAIGKFISSNALKGAKKLPHDTLPDLNLNLSSDRLTRMNTILGKVSEKSVENITFSTEVIDDFESNEQNYYYASGSYARFLDYNNPGVERHRVPVFTNDGKLTPQAQHMIASATTDSYVLELVDNFSALLGVPLRASEINVPPDFTLPNETFTESFVREIDKFLKGYFSTEANSSDLTSLSPGNLSTFNKRKRFAKKFIKFLENFMPSLRAISKTQNELIINRFTSLLDPNNENQLRFFNRELKAYQQTVKRFKPNQPLTKEQETQKQYLELLQNYGFVGYLLKNNLQLQDYRKLLTSNLPVTKVTYLESDAGVTRQRSRVVIGGGQRISDNVKVFTQRRDLPDVTDLLVKTAEKKIIEAGLKAKKGAREKVLDELKKNLRLDLNTLYNDLQSKRKEGSLDVAFFDSRVAEFSKYLSTLLKDIVTKLPTSIKSEDLLEPLMRELKTQLIDDMLFEEMATVPDGETVASMFDRNVFEHSVALELYLLYQNNLTKNSLWDPEKLGTVMGSIGSRQAIQAHHFNQFLALNQDLTINTQLRPGEQKISFESFNVEEIADTYEDATVLPIYFNLSTSLHNRGESEFMYRLNHPAVDRLFNPDEYIERMDKRVQKSGERQVTARQVLTNDTREKLHKSATNYSFAVASGAPKEIESKTKSLQRQMVKIFSLKEMEKSHLDTLWQNMSTYLLLGKSKVFEWDSKYIKNGLEIASRTLSNLDSLVTELESMYSTLKSKSSLSTPLSEDELEFLSTEKSLDNLKQFQEKMEMLTLFLGEMDSLLQKNPNLSFNELMSQVSITHNGMTKAPWANENALKNSTVSIKSALSTITTTPYFMSALFSPSLNSPSKLFSAVVKQADTLIDSTFFKGMVDPEEVTLNLGITRKERKKHEPIRQLIENNQFRKQIIQAESRGELFRQTLSNMLIESSNLPPDIANKIKGDFELMLHRGTDMLAKDLLLDNLRSYVSGSRYSSIMNALGLDDSLTQGDTFTPTLRSNSADIQSLEADVATKWNEVKGHYNDVLTTLSSVTLEQMPNRDQVKQTVEKLIAKFESQLRDRRLKIAQQEYAAYELTQEKFRTFANESEEEDIDDLSDVESEVDSDEENPLGFDL